MLRSLVSLAFLKQLYIFALLILFLISISGCGEDSFTGEDPPTTTTPGPQQQGPGTTPPTTPTSVSLGIPGVSEFQSGLLNVGVSPLSARGTTAITGFLVDEDGNAYTTPVAFEFTSNCIEDGTASIDEAPVYSVNGVVEVTYRAEGCVGEDIIVATGSTSSSNLSASATVTIQPATAGAIEFVSADPTTISLQGTAGIGLTETSTVTFRVVDDGGRDVAGATVNFSLSTTIGDITLDQTSGTTSTDGTVQVAVSSGTVNTSVRVVATTDTATATVTTQSVALAISTGIPDDDSFQIAASAFRPTAWECNGEEVTITAYASDHFNNPAPDGTAIAFRTESGSIQGSCNTVGGECSVTWQSAGVRPTDGRTTILATVLGEESYTDTTPSNGRFDDGESFTDLEEAFLDINENGIRDGANEESVDHNGNGLHDPADGTYNGVLCSIGSTICNTNSPLLTIGDDLVLAMASRNQILTIVIPTFDPVTGDVVSVDPLNGPIVLPDDGSTITLRLDFKDIQGVQPPSGSSISVSTTTGELLGATSTDIPDGNGKISVNGVPTIVPASMFITLKADDNPEPGVLTVALDMPASACDAGATLEIPRTITINDVSPPTIASASPASGDTGVALNSIITIEFDDDMQISTLVDITNNSLPNITLTRGGTTVALSGSYDPTQRILTIFPADGVNLGETLQAGSLYRLTLSGNPTAGIQDDAGNFLYTGNDPNVTDVIILFSTVATP